MRLLVHNLEQPNLLLVELWCVAVLNAMLQ